MANLTNSSATTKPIDPIHIYRPHRLLRNGNMQTFLGQHIPADAWFVTKGEQMILFDAGPDQTGVDPARAVRLLGYYTPSRSRGNTRAKPKGLVMLLHGWEGDSHSAYNLVLGSALVRDGYDVVRLNLRDHGRTHHLNKGIFYATLIEEVHAATQQVGLLAAGRPFYLIGASLGGSFVVRMALRHARSPIPNLRRAMAINPVLNPGRTSFVLDDHLLLRKYFRGCWLESLRKKQALFPDLYDFAPLASISTIREMSNWVIKSMTTFSDVDEYLNAYAVRPMEFNDLAVPVSILTAANDPLIPPQDIAALPSNPLLQVNILPFGGHVGFNDLFPFRHRLPELVRLLLDQDAGQYEY